MPIPDQVSLGDSGHIQDHNDISSELTDINTDLSNKLSLSGGTLTGAISGTSATFSGTVTAATPTSSGHLATKGYVDSNQPSGGVPGLSKVLMLEATVTPQDIVPWYYAVFPAGSFAANNGWNSKIAYFMAGVTLPAGQFSSTPYLALGTPSTYVNDKVDAIPLSATSVFITYTNFNGQPGTNSGQTYGPVPASIQSLTVKLMVMSQ